MTEDADNLETIEEISSSDSEYCPRCYPLFSGENIFNLVKGLLFYIFSYSLCSRLITLLLLLQTAVLWLGYSLNIVLQLLFIPFLYSSVDSKYNVIVFLACDFILPGIISFSSHYFWFIIQFAFHCYTSNETREEKLNEKTVNKNDTDDLLYFPEKKHIYRCFITISMVVYMTFRRFIMDEDRFRTLFASVGLFPLFLMGILHIVHLFSIYCFVRKSITEKINANVSSSSTTNNDDTQYFRTFVIFTALTIAYNARQSETYSLNVLRYTIIGLLFSSYILLFIQTPIEMIHIGNNQKCPCSNNKSTEEKISFYKPKALKVRLIKKIIQISLSMKQNQQYHIYKLFIVIILHVMLISLNHILSHFFHQRNLLLINILNIIPILLWVPPVFNQQTNQWILNIQMSLVGLLIILMHFISSIGVVILLLLNSLSNRMAALFLLVVLAYTVALIHYYRQHWIKYSSLSMALKKWIKSHESTGIYLQAFSIVFVLLSIIGFLGFSFACSIYVETVYDKSNLPLYPIQLSGSFEKFSNDEQQRHYRMQACYWKFNNFDIQDMTLFAALAYVPKAELKSQIKHFFPNDQVVFVDQFQNYKEYGHGEITYYTLDTPETVIVVIRGTTLSYEWLVDFDIWTESTINQMISILFPWSRLYPRGVHKIIVEKMSLLENFFSDKLTQSSKRFYVKQMIKLLREINVKFKNKPLILVGHSLGGGLAQLAGIAMNNTVAVVSISGPGISNSRAKYSETKDILMETINERVFNIINDRDLVPWVDPQVGLVQKITCPNEFSRLQCHQISPILCNLLKSCGNPRKFKINQDICRP
ncbi:unnamed protein product [Rotaria sp. Silwood1]|nr:unnamed protein product [Rotaria sp. Silwood1]CAF3864508.1 unnamed protein product [Rotaria sp. Silwood1]CAF4880944.1 unnamed protein product [Rotaria sp. Silwood1]